MQAAMARNRQTGSISLLLAGGLCLLPFLLPDHHLPLLSFQSEWLAAALGVAAMLTALAGRGGAFLSGASTGTVVDRVRAVSCCANTRWQTGLSAVAPAGCALRAIRSAACLAGRAIGSGRRNRARRNRARRLHAGRRPRERGSRHDPVLRPTSAAGGRRDRTTLCRGACSRVRQHRERQIFLPIILRSAGSLVVPVAARQPALGLGGWRLACCWPGPAPLPTRVARCCMRCGLFCSVCSPVGCRPAPARGA